MRSVLELVSFDNPLLGSFLFWSAVLALKTALMSFLPTVQPLLTKVRYVTATGEAVMFLFNRSGKLHNGTVS